MKMMHKMEKGEMECARCSIERGILCGFNGDWLCEECYDYVNNKIRVRK